MDIKKKTAIALAAEGSVQIVTFRVGGEEYGLDIGCIAEVIRPLKITPLPRMPEFIEGVINLRGAIIPVVDLRRRFGAAHADPAAGRSTVRMMITKGAFPGSAGRKQTLLALVVDGVQEVLHLAPDQIEAAPPAATGRNAEFIAGMGKLSDRLIILIHLARILTHQERAALAEARDVHS